MRRVVRRTACGVAALPVDTVLVGCSSQPATPPPTEARPGVGEVTSGDDGVHEVTLQVQDDYVFTPNAFTVEPGDVRLTLTNVGEQLVDDLRSTAGGPAPIDEQIDTLPAGEEETIGFTVDDPGGYPFERSFHVQLNQVGTMTVSGQ